MLGSKALRTCSVCRDKLRSIRLVQAGPSRGINTQPDSRTIDDSVFTSHPLTDPSPGYGLNKLDGSREAEDEEEEWVPREERRSPAAVFGSKRVGLEVVPRRMEENIQSEINSMSLLHLFLFFIVPLPHHQFGLIEEGDATWKEADIRSPPPRNPGSTPILPNDKYKTEIKTREI
jgi:hypothetical protein